MEETISSMTRRLQSSTDRTIGLVDQFCTSGDISIHSFQIGVDGPYVSLVTVILSLVYLTMGFVIIYFIKIQERNARMGDSDATNSVIFPVFVTCLWINSFVNMYIGVVFFADIWMKNVFLPALLFALVFTLQHMLVDGIAILLMKKGLGWDGARQCMPIIASWGAFTGVCKFMTFYSKFSSVKAGSSNWLAPFANLMNFLWSVLLVLFYFLLWAIPQKNLFRRPAAINYAAFWFLFRFFALVCAIIGAAVEASSDGNIGYCILEVSPFFIIAALEPIVVYFTLLQDSRWWQGLDIRQGRRRREIEDIRFPLEGVDIGLGAAQALANTLDFMQEEEVRLLNFAYINLDKNGKNMLGSGSFSKVYKGAYKGEVCAVKLIFTVDLTADVIRRVAAEAQILSRIVHVNIVKTLGVSVLPPSVCILLEYCEMGSLQDVLKGSGIFTSTGRISSRLLFSPHVQVLKPEDYAPDRYGVNSIGTPWLDGTGIAMQAGGKVNTSHLTTATGSLYQLNEEESDAGCAYISTADRLWLALGCAAGVGALHEYNSNLCHRDIKSFNFLVDAYLCVKLADMELGQSEELDAKGTLHSNRDGTSTGISGVSRTSLSEAGLFLSRNSILETGVNKRTQPKVNSGEPFNVTSDIDSCNSINLEHSPPGAQLRKSLISTDNPITNASGVAQVAADVTGNALSNDDFLANWAAPEVVRGHGHTQAADIYSTSLVLWELLSGQVPYSISGETYQSVRQDEVRRRILLGERPEVPMIYGDKVSNVEGNAGESEDESSKFRESLDQRSSRQRGLSLNSGSIATTLHDTEDRRSALYDGYGNGISGVKNKDPLGKITPAAHNVVSARSPYAAFIRLMRRCWAESPSYRHSARELYEEIHTIWRSICHRLVMYVQYDPNTNSNYSAAGRSSPTLDSRVSQATGCSGISAYHNPYERATSALIRNQSSIGSTFSALVRSVSQADKDRPFPPLVRQSSSVGNFSPISRTNSQAEPKTWISIGNSSPIAAENIHSKPSATESASSDKVSSENFQSVLACVAADPSYAALDADGGAWVIVSNDSPHFILRSTFAFCDMFGINCACEGQSLVDALDCPKGVDVELLNKFLYEMTLFNIHESVMRRKETAKCTTALYPSYFCNHALLSLFGADFTDRALHPKHSTDSDRNPHKFDAHTTEKTLRSKSTSTLSSNTYNSMHGDAENGTKRNSKGVFLYKFSVHAFPLFAASPVNPGTAETVEEEDDLSDAASITSARSSKTGLDDTNARMAITADMSPVVYALYFSKFKKIVERSRASSESYTSALSGMVRGLGSMMPAFTGNGITSSQTATTKSRPPKAVQRI